MSLFDNPCNVSLFYKSIPSTAVIDYPMITVHFSDLHTTHQRAVSPWWAGCKSLYQLRVGDVMADNKYRILLEADPKVFG